MPKGPAPQSFAVPARVENDELSVISGSTGGGPVPWFIGK
jgi:hypothetical protein